MCFYKIPKGGKYGKQISSDGGDIMTHRECLECNAIIQEAFKAGELSERDFENMAGDSLKSYLTPEVYYSLAKEAGVLESVKAKENNSNQNQNSSENK